MRKQPHPFLSVFCPYARDPVTDKTENLENTLRAMMLRLPKEDLESWLVHTGNTGLIGGFNDLIQGTETLYRSSCTIEVCGEMPS